MLLFLQDLTGDSFDIPENFDKLWIDNCCDFKTVPAHIVELNVKNCASFETVPDTVEYLTVHNCPLLEITEKIKNKITAMNNIRAEKFKTKINTTPAVKFIETIFTN